jgi:hypothetical protein
MGFSKFEFRPIESFQDTGGFGWDSAEAAGARRSVLDSWSRTHANFGCPFQTCIFSAIFQL